MRYKPYPSYKPSGVEWLGDVPGHWRRGRISGLFRFRSGGTPNTGDASYWDGDIPWVSAKDMKVLRIVDTEDHITAEAIFESAATMVPEGAVLLVTRSGILKHTLPVAVALRPVAINQDIKGLVVVAGQINPLYFAYWVQGNQGTLLTLWRQQGATVESVNFEALKASPVPLPPVGDQALIANFLDAQTAKLDILMAKKRALIEKLKEKRTALISRTVTRGLPPDAARAAGLDPRPKLKPSGIDWLGDVPEHWEVKRFRYVVARLDQGWSPNAENSPAESDQWGVLKLSAAREGQFLPEENKALDELPDGIVLITPEEGDVLVSRSNTPDRVGDACLVPKNYPRLIVPDLLYRLKLDARSVSPAYVCVFLLSRSGRAQIEADARGSSGSMVKLGQSHLLAWLIPLPPLGEQRAITEFLDRETAKIDWMIGKVEAAIDRLQEYRTALITATVTGKIDVRNETVENRA